MSRLEPPVQFPPVPGESNLARNRRLHQNRLARRAWESLASQTCQHCGFARINVVHEEDPATAPEGPGYYADFLDQLHPFVRWAAP